MAAMWATIIGLLLALHPVTSSRMLLPLQGDVGSIGHFYVTLHIGQPPKQYYLDIDTGSNLTWVECNYDGEGDHCCNQVPNQLYTPGTHNLGKVACGDPMCKSLHQDLGVPHTCDKRDPHHCHYEIKYIDGGSAGLLVGDKIILPGSRQPKLFAFGCGYKQDPCNKETPVDGLLGLGKGTIGFVAHLKKHGKISKNVIAHCMSSHGGGYISFGEGGENPSGVTWVPMSRSSKFYSPGQATLKFDNQPIGDNTMEVIFDSGATYTYVPTHIYDQLISKLRVTLSESLTEVHDLDSRRPHCWKETQPFRSIDDLKNRKNLKPLSLTFANNAIMDIPPKNYLIRWDGQWCLGIHSAAEESKLPGNLCLIGAVTMQDQLVIYDNERGLLGWVRPLEGCPSPRTSEPVITSRL